MGLPARQPCGRALRRLARSLLCYGLFRRRLPDRFRGRRLRLRFLTTGLKAGSAPLWHPSFINNTAINPDPRDDGWFIDDVTVTDTLVTPATVIVERLMTTVVVGATFRVVTAATVKLPGKM